MTNIRRSPFDSPVVPGSDRTPSPPTPDSVAGAGSRWSATNQEQPPSQQKMLSDLLRWEGDCHHLYLDSHGLVTVGIGNLVGSAAAATELPFVDKHTGRPATPAQIVEAFDRVSHLHKGPHAGAFASATTLRLPEDAVRALAAERLSGEFLPALRRDFPGFDNFPAPAQRALVDMAYNLGVGGLEKFHQLRDAVDAGDWRTAAAECHRRTCRAERNDWTRDLFSEAAASVPGPTS